MTQFDDLIIKKIIVHQVGNKFQNDGVKYSESSFAPNEAIALLLCKYFLSSFKADDKEYQFYNEVDIRFNEVNGISYAIFNNPDAFVEQSKKIALHLYDESNHPNIKTGEVYIVQFERIDLNNQSQIVIGIFKSENKDTYLKVYPEGHAFRIRHDKGININRLDKGCLIFNEKSESGYRIYITDNSSKTKGEEAKYWKERFLQIRPINNDYVQTENILSICREFISNLPDNEMGKSFRSSLLNQALTSLHSDKIDLTDFIEKSFGHNGLSKEFSRFLSSKKAEEGIEFDDVLTPSQIAIRKNNKSNSITTIKLDDNFDIRMRGNTELLERGYDETRQLNYYKLYFKIEK